VSLTRPAGGSNAALTLSVPLFNSITALLPSRSTLPYTL
jgi:hypothetical protein